MPRIPTYEQRTGTAFQKSTRQQAVSETTNLNTGTVADNTGQALQGLGQQVGRLEQQQQKMREQERKKLISQETFDNTLRFDSDLNEEIGKLRESSEPNAQGHVLAVDKAFNEKFEKYKSNFKTEEGREKFRRSALLSYEVKTKNESIFEAQKSQEYNIELIDQGYLNTAKNVSQNPELLSVYKQEFKGMIEGATLSDKVTNTLKKNYIQKMSVEAGRALAQNDPYRIMMDKENKTDAEWQKALTPLQQQSIFNMADGNIKKRMAQIQDSVNIKYNASLESLDILEPDQLETRKEEIDIAFSDEPEKADNMKANLSRNNMVNKYSMEQDNLTIQELTGVINEPVKKTGLKADQKAEMYKKQSASRLVTKMLKDPVAYVVQGDQELQRLQQTALTENTPQAMQAYLSSATASLKRYGLGTNELLTKNMKSSLIVGLSKVPPDSRLIGALHGVKSLYGSYFDKVYSSIDSEIPAAYRLILDSNDQVTNEWLAQSSQYSVEKVYKDSSTVSKGDVEDSIKTNENWLKYVSAMENDTKGKMKVDGLYSEVLKVVGLNTPKNGDINQVIDKTISGVISSNFNFIEPSSGFLGFGGTPIQNTLMIPKQINGRTLNPDAVMKGVPLAIKNSVKNGLTIRNVRGVVTQDLQADQIMDRLVLINTPNGQGVQAFTKTREGIIKAITTKDRKPLYFSYMDLINSNYKQQDIDEYNDSAQKYMDRITGTKRTETGDDITTNETNMIRGKY